MRSCRAAARTPKRAGTPVPVRGHAGRRIHGSRLEKRSITAAAECRRLARRLWADTVDAARANGFAAVSVNDHFLFGAPWLDGLTALAAVAERSGPMTLATTVSLAALRGPVPLAKAVA